MPVKDIRSKRSRVHVEIAVFYAGLILSLFPCYVSLLFFLHVYISVSTTAQKKIKGEKRKVGEGEGREKGGKDPKNTESHRILLLPLKHYELESFDGLANGTFIPRSPVILDGTKWSANFSITFSFYSEVENLKLKIPPRFDLLPSPPLTSRCNLVPLFRFEV